MNIDEKGFPNINTEEILKGFKLNLNEYLKYDFENDFNNFPKVILQSNSNFNIIEILQFLAKINKTNNKIKLNPYIEDVLTNIDNLYKNIHIYKRENNNHNAQSSQLKIKKASMTVELNGKIKKFKKITFSLGGQSSRFNSRPGFNIKIRNKENLYGRNQIKLRTDSNEATYLRTKIATDIHNYLGIPSIASNYATLYINNEYMGLYILMDSFKLSWVEHEYGEEKTNFLYKCDGSAYLTLDTAHNCVNENGNIKHKYQKKWLELIRTIDNANSAEDIENIFDIDQFLTEIAIEYLLGSYDHFLQAGRNYYMFKPPHKKSMKNKKIIKEKNEVSK